MKKLDVEYDLVFIIDCLPQEQRNEYKISEDLMAFLASKGVKQLQAKCNNKAMFLETFSYMNKLADSGLKFCLQIVSHGSEEGLWLHETEIDIFWDEFQKQLYDLNKKLSNTLILNMTCCRGLNGMKIIDENAVEYPFFGLIGCNRDLEVGEGRITNEKFYTKLLEGKDISVIVPEIQKEFTESGSSDIFIYCMSSEAYKTIKNVLGKS